MIFKRNVRNDAQIVESWSSQDELRQPANDRRADEMPKKEYGNTRAHCSMQREEVGLQSSIIFIEELVSTLKFYWF